VNYLRETYTEALVCHDTAARMTSFRISHFPLAINSSFNRCTINWFAAEPLETNTAYCAPTYSAISLSYCRTYLSWVQRLLLFRKKAEIFSLSQKVKVFSASGQLYLTLISPPRSQLLIHCKPTQDKTFPAMPSFSANERKLGHLKLGPDLYRF